MHWTQIVVAFATLSCWLLIISVAFQRRWRGRSLSLKRTLPLELPPPPAYFEGRDEELAGLRHALLGRLERDEPALVLIQGPGGMGKTTLAIHLASTLRDTFPAGQLFARLSGRGSPADEESILFGVLRDFVFALQNPGSATPDDFDTCLTGYRALSEGKKLLVVLDDVPADLNIARLLPRGRASGVIVTSRGSVAGPPIADDQVCRLGPLSMPAARRLLERATGRTDTVLEAVARECGGHPLALRLAANALADRPRWEPHDVRRAMASIHRSADGRPQPFDITYGFLSADERLALRCLAGIDGPDFAPWMLAAVAEVDEDEARVLAARLAHLRLLERHSSELSAEPRYLIDEPVHEYARARAEAEDPPGTRERRAALLHEAREDRRSGRAKGDVREHVFRLMNAGDLSRALTEARAALALATELSDARAEGAARCVIAEIAAELGNLSESEQMARRGVERMARQAAKHGGAGSAALPDPGTRARAHRCLGHVLRRRDALAMAAGELGQALSLARAAADRGEQIRVLTERAKLDGVRGRPDAALEALDEAEGLCDVLGRAQLPIILLARGVTLYYLGRHDDAVPVLSQARAGAERAGKRLTVGESSYWTAMVQLRRKDYLQAWEDGTLALQAFIGMRHRYGAARCRHALGEAALRLGRPGEAVRNLRESVEALHSCGDPWIEEEAQRILAEATHQAALHSRSGNAVLRSLNVDAMLPRRRQARDLRERDGLAG